MSGDGFEPIEEPTVDIDQPEAKPQRRLTDREQLIIAMRAHGSYGVIPAMQKIVTIHRKNRNLDDAVFLDFAKLTLKKHEWDDYERLGRAVLAIIPEPFGAPYRAPTAEEVVEEDLAPKIKSRRTVTCSICSKSGHNAKTCPDKPNTPTVQCADGLTRLTPGFNLGVPSEISSDI